ncbi:flagellar biosynthesis anti-sigma factor FlgM [Aeromonas schubertii]|uniref:flagellar biosynthesis anti-sigma factor FlgM n=1 Tax=Aeromonas schubertii TaxID=652 RepID=UPI00067EFF62|nr:flagellar biosynthesis anti-sigma factor FlgM [Aeromonas schubertii]KUE81702.1 flagellar biosynthesis anti-sigma factor FlgM [Aeromonas schubertii]
MAINNINNLANSRLQSSGTGQSAANKAGNGVASDSRTSATRQDSVSLTSEAQQLQQMQKTLSSGAGGNESRVESLKKAIASGEYQVDSQRVAKKMASFEGQLDKLLG